MIYLYIQFVLLFLLFLTLTRFLMKTQSQKCDLLYFINLLIYPIHLISIILHIFCGRKPEHLEETHRHEETRLIHGPVWPGPEPAGWHQ